MIFPSSILLPLAAGAAGGLTEGEAERKVAFVLEHSIRADRAAAERLLNDQQLRQRTLAELKQNVEVLHMYGHPLADLDRRLLQRRIKSTLIPRLEFVAYHACAPACSTALWSRVSSLLRD